MAVLMKPAVSNRQTTLVKSFFILKEKNIMEKIILAEINNHAAIEVATEAAIDEDLKNAEDAADSIRWIQHENASASADRGVAVFNALVSRGVRKFVFEHSITVDLDDDDDDQWVNSGSWDFYQRLDAKEAVINGDVAVIR